LKAVRGHDELFHSNRRTDEEDSMATIKNSRTRSAIRFPKRATRRSAARNNAPAAEQPSEVVATIRQRISIAVVHRNTIAREGLALLLSGQPDMRIAQVGPNAGDSSPDIVLLAISGNDRETLREASAVLAAAPDARVIVVGPLASCADLARQVQAEVFGFVLDDATPEELLQTVRSVAAGTHVWPPVIAKSLFSQISRENAVAPKAVVASAHLTPREREVMELIADGLSTKEMARKLGVAGFTVRAHVRNIMEKLNIHTRLAIAAFVHRERAGEADGASLPMGGLAGAFVPGMRGAPRAHQVIPA